jgi:hypothetical protein
VDGKWGMAAKVFISYRRDDSKYQARIICSAFQRALAHENVFMDVDSIAPGVDFVASGKLGESVRYPIGSDWPGMAHHHRPED